MATDLYDLGVEGMLDQSIDLLNDDIRIMLVESDYVRDLAADKFVSDIGGTILDRSGAITGKTITGRVFDCDDTIIPTVPSGTGHQVIMFQHTGSDATARLICNWDAGTGLDITTNGSDVNVKFSNGANKVFAIARNT